MPVKATDVDFDFELNLMKYYRGLNVSIHGINLAPTKSLMGRGIEENQV